MSEHARLVKLALSYGQLPGEQRALEAQLEKFDGDDHCGGYPPPCGGCSRCCQQQAAYYAVLRADRRRRMAALGLLVHDLIELPWLPGREAVPMWRRPT